MNKKIAIVTGASSGFGLLAAVKLARSFFVIATSRQPEKAEQLRELAAAHNVSDSIHITALDVTDEQSIVSFGKAVSAYAPIDLLVNNAGTAYGGFIEDVPMEHFRQQFETNVFGVIHVTKTVLPYIRKHGGAKIINVSSISGLTGFPALSPYVSSKHALEGFSESLRIELLPFGIETALIEPGSYKTSIWSTSLSNFMSVPADDSAYHQYYKKILSYVQKKRRRKRRSPRGCRPHLSIGNKTAHKEFAIPDRKGHQAHPAVPIAFSLVCVGVYPEEKAIQLI